MHGAYCLGVFPNGKDHTTLLGGKLISLLCSYFGYFHFLRTFHFIGTCNLILSGIVVRNTLVVYDRENSKVGFWRTNCSELSDRLHIDGATPPATLPSNDSNPSQNSSSNLPGLHDSCRFHLNSFVLEITNCKKDIISVSPDVCGT